MTAVTADNTTFFLSKLIDSEGMKVDLPVAASTTIYKNTAVGLTQNGHLSSYVAPAAGATVTGTSFRGIALAHVDNSAGSSGAEKTCEVLIQGYVTYTLTSVAVTDVGAPVYVTDNATLSADASAGAYFGQIVAYDTTNTCTIKLNPFGSWAGKFLSVVSPAIDFCTLNQLCLLVHETDNHNGLYLCQAVLVTTEVHACTAAAGVITLTHTRGTNTSLGCTITALDNQPVSDVMPGVGGQLWGAGDVTGGTITGQGDPIVKVPAGQSVEAKVTTASDEGTVETGQGKIYATFMAC